MRFKPKKKELFEFKNPLATFKGDGYFQKPFECNDKKLLKKAFAAAESPDR